MLFRSARRFFEVAIKGEDPADESDFGMMLVDGVGGPADLRRGMNLLAEAGNRGVESAQFKLASLARDRNDMTTAEFWLSKLLPDCGGIGSATSRGHAEKVRAAAWLGGIYLARAPKGEARTQSRDYIRARYCMYRAAEQGDPDARQWVTANTR